MLTEAQIRTISAAKKQRIHDGSGLYLELRPLRTGGTGKYFIGRTRYPLGGPMVDVTVGSWGRDPGQLSLKAARNEWTQLKAWALAEGKDPRDKRRNEKVGLHLQQQVPTLGEYAEHYLEIKAKTIKPETIRDSAKPNAVQTPAEEEFDNMNQSTDSKKQYKY